MPTEPKKITRATLARYAGLLGPRSIAMEALDLFDVAKAFGQRPQIFMRNNGFRVTLVDKQGRRVQQDFG